VRFGEDDMVVGRTLWDFILEIFGMPGFTTVIIVRIILLELILILVLLLVHAGLLDLKLSYGDRAWSCTSSSPWPGLLHKT